MKQKIVLIVDDEPIVRLGTVMIIQSLGFDAKECSSGEAALSELCNTVFDAIIMDCNMPDMDGLACTTIIRERERGSGKRIPILGWTSNEEATTRNSCIKAGMNDCLHKTSSVETLKSTLKQLLNAN
ncbi:hypothetical protein BH11CYA1_BH11CYA1_13190 [soil metagenome]